MDLDILQSSLLVLKFVIGSKGTLKSKKILNHLIYLLTLQHVNVWMIPQIFTLEWILFGLTKIGIWVQNLLIPVRLEEELIWKH